MEISQSQEGERVCQGMRLNEYRLYIEGFDIVWMALLNLWTAPRHWNKTLEFKKVIKMTAYHFHRQVQRNQFVSSHRHTGSSLQYSCLRACKVDHGTDQASCDKMNESNLDENNTVITQISDTWLREWADYRCFIAL